MPTVASVTGEVGPFEFLNPVDVHFGRGRLRELEALVSRPTLIVTSAGTMDRVRIESIFRDRDDIHVYSGVTPNPGQVAIDEGAALGESLDVRTIVGLGGGSALDAATCIALLAGNDDSVLSLRQRLTQSEQLTRRVRLIQAPTSAGSGSEVTRWASVWEPDGRKWSLEHPTAYADVALVDPSLTDTMGPRLTAATGLDALAHAVESIWSTGATPPGDALAVSALRLVRTALPSTVSHPDPEGRDSMALAALLAGLALASARSATAHALSYSLTGRFGIEHGLATGLMCRALLPSYAEACAERVSVIMEALSVSSFSEAEAFIDEVFRLAGLEPSLRFFGLSEEDLHDVARDATQADRIGNSRLAPGIDELLSALRRVA